MEEIHKDQDTPRRLPLGMQLAIQVSLLNILL